MLSFVNNAQRDYTSRVSASPDQSILVEVVLTAGDR